jgi:hypothetical protein
LASSTSKKVVIRRFDREAVTGFVNPRTYLQPAGIEILTPAGTVSIVPYAEVKVVCFVRDFPSAEIEPEQKLFHARPKMDGLWARMRFTDDEILDGLLPNDLLQMDSFGFTMVPPNPSSSNQKFFVPRSALREFHILGVIGSPLRLRKAKPAPKTQLEMFE